MGQAEEPRLPDLDLHGANRRVLPVRVRPPLQARVSDPCARALSPSPLGRGPHVHVGSETTVSPVGHVLGDGRSLGVGQPGTVCVM